MAALTWTITVDADSAAVSPAANSQGPIECFLNMEGDFGSGTITWESRPTGGTNYNAIKDMAFTAEEGGVLLCHPGIDYRTRMEGSTSPDVDVTITRAGDVAND
tara:strand:+ start:37 stop:348 length:312 start_codon:yes stop_codon:yes gene_type:complete